MSVGRILLCCPRKPESHSKGDAHRAFQTMTALESLGYSVDLLYPEKSDSTSNEFHPSRPSFGEMFFSVLRAAVSPDRSFQEGIFVGKNCKKVFLKCIFETSYDAIILVTFRLVELLRTAIKSQIATPIIFDLVDAFSLNYQRIAQNSKKSFAKLAYSVEGKRIRKIEKMVAQKSSKTLFVSLKDARFLKMKNSFVVPLNVNFDYREEKSLSEKKDDLKVVFHGNLSYKPNEEAAFFIVNELAPKMEKLDSSLSFHFVGRGGRKILISAIDKSKNCHFIGEVSDIMNEVSKYDISICPTKSGAGTQNKILESVSLKIPVIASDESASGTYFIPSKEILVSRTAEDYINNILFLKSPLQRKGIAERAFKKLERVYSPEVTEKLWRIILHDVTK